MHKFQLKLNIFEEHFISSFSSVQSLSHVRLFVTPWTAVRQASLSITNSQSSLKLMSIEPVMPSSHLILCCLLLLLPPIPPSIRIFSSESALRERWSKYWSFFFTLFQNIKLAIKSQKRSPFHYPQVSALFLSFEYKEYFSFIRKQWFWSLQNCISFNLMTYHPNPELLRVLVWLFPSESAL